MTSETAKLKYAADNVPKLYKKVKHIKPVSLVPDFIVDYSDPSIGQPRNLQPVMDEKIWRYRRVPLV